MGVRFEEILERHEREIYRFARRLTGNASDASDVLQDTFLRAFRAFSRLPEEANHRAWLYRIAGRSASNLKRSARARRDAPLDAAAHVAGANGNLEAVVETKQLQGLVRETLRALSSRQRLAFIQRKHEGRSYAEIASLLGCSEQTARAHVYQAMTRIRKRLAQAIPGSGSERSRGGVR